MTTTADYSGPDRRARNRTPGEERRGGAPRRHHGGRLLLLFVVALCLAAVSGRVAGRYLEATTLGGVRQGLGTVAISLFVAAGLAYLLRWKLTGEAPVALVGVALLVYGVGIGAFLPVGPALVGEQSSPAISSGLVRVVVSAVAMYLLVRSLSTHVVDSGLRPGRTFAVALLGVAVVFGVVGEAVQLRALAPPPAALDVVLHSLIGAGWAGAAYLLVRRAADRLQGDVLWVGLALVCLALSNLMRALAGGDNPAGMLAAAAVSVLAGGVALYGTTLHLTELLAGQGSERLRLYVDLVASEVQQRSQQASREERLHDARSTLAAIRVAAGTLQRYEDKLQATQRESLQTAVTAELVRLEHLIDPPPGDRLQLFRLADGLSAVVETERALGSDITLQLRDASAYARPDDVARIVQNLLVNARRHAPGSSVRLSAVVRDGFVTVSVADEGPGVPAELREAVFDRGHRGKRTGGSGLGLYVARQLAGELGGSLAVHARVGGGAVFSLRLPSGPPEQAPDEVADRADVGQDQRRRGAVRRQQHRRLGGDVGEAQYVATVTRRVVAPGEHLDGVGFV